MVFDYLLRVMVGEEELRCRMELLVAQWLDSVVAPAASDGWSWSQPPSAVSDQTTTQTYGSLGEEWEEKVMHKISSSPGRVNDNESRLASVDTVSGANQKWCNLLS